MMKKYLVKVLIITISIVLLVFLNMKGSSIYYKVIGICCMLVIAIMIIQWIKDSQKSPLKNKMIRLTLNDKYWLNENIPFYTKLKPSDKLIFEDRVRLFLGEIIITEVGKETPEKSTCFYVASSAVIAFWGLPYWNYGRLSEVLVYPTNFDADNQLNETGNVLGKVHHGGLMDTTMILSLPALIKGFTNTTDKQNVGVHEFSHLIDKADGVIDGLPFGMTEIDELTWMDLAEVEIQKIANGKSDINPYGMTNKAEFFAVVIEYYKENPKLFAKKHPKFFELLERYFKSDSLS